MGFTKAGTSIDKQWVVCISRRFSNCKGCGLCKFIIVTDDKGIKNIFGIEVSFFTATVNIGKNDITASVMKQAMDMSYRCGMAEFKVDLLEKMMRMGVAIKRGTFNDCLVNTGLELLSDGDS